jgi:acyl carrier protein phosphodiesterase
MNYLAHIYLSGDDDFIKIGNFIADGIKGKKYITYPKNIQIGILLHRQIDWFSDNDDIVKRSKRRLDKRYGHYKGVIIDIFYDHYLAKNWKRYSDVPLQEYTHEFYTILQDNIEILPERIKYLMNYMINDDWLANYANLKGIERVLIGMNRRTKEVSKMDLAIHDLEANYEEFEKDFEIFFKKLSNFTTKTLKEINEKMDQKK